MTNVRRPIHLQLRSPSSTPTPISSPKALSPSSADSLPSQILPHLFVGNQEQTNRETVNRLSISYILSLGLLPLISSSVSPTSPTAAATTTTANNIKQQKHNYHQAQHNHQQHHHNNNHNHHQISMPSRNSSKDFKIRVRTNALAASHSHPQTPSSLATAAGFAAAATAAAVATTPARDNENKGVKQIRWVQCKCINIADSSEQILSKFFDEAHQFIDEARRRKCNILVHCQAGISRSPTIAIAYLMRVNSLPLQDAYNLVKQCRPQTDPNLSFMGQLMLYEKSLEASASASSSSTTTTTTTTASNTTTSVTTTTTTTTSTKQHHHHQQQNRQQQRKSVTQQQQQDTKLL